MTEFARYIASLGPMYQLFFLFVFLAIVWALTKISPRLRPYSGQILVLASILYMGALFAFLTFSFPQPRGLMASATNAGTVPRVWFAALVPCVVLALIPILTGEEKPDPAWGNVRLVALVLAVVAASLALFDVIGYYLSSVLFMFSIMWVLDCRSKVQLICAPVGWVIFTYFTFARLLHLPLPVGRLFSFLIN